MKKETTNLMHHKKTVRETRARAGSGANMLKGLTLMLVMTLIMIGCDSIVDQNTEADAGIATSDISGVLSVEVSTIECIDPDAGEYHVVSESKSVEWGNRRNPFEKTVEIEYYNTLTEFVLRVKSTEMIADVLVDDESIKDFDGTVEAGTWQEFTLDLGEGGTQTFSLKVAGSGPPVDFEVNYTLLSECVTTCGGNVTFMYNGSDVTYGTVTGANDRCWLDRNLGANRVAESSTDSEAYGDLFQWGRAADGHQLRNSDIYNTSLASTFEPNKGNAWDGKFITTNITPFDWLEPQDNDLWQGVDGINNPCPVGYRLPTADEWLAERQSWGDNSDAEGAFASLALPVAGFRDASVGTLFNDGSFGNYWSGTVDGTHPRRLFFGSSSSGMRSDRRAYGYSVRCLKEDTSD